MNLESIRKMFNKLKYYVKNYLLSKSRYQFVIHDWVQLKDIQQASDMMSTLRFSRNLAPILSEGPRFKRVLIIAPHPDDESMGPGGTMLKLLDQGVIIKVVYLTDGNLECCDALVSEAREVSNRYGYEGVSLGYMAKEIPVNDSSARKLAEEVEEFKPGAIFIPFCLDDHDDHRRASELLLYAAHRQFISTDYDIWAYQVYTVLLPNIIVDISEYAERKAEMIKLWHSQSRKRNWAHYTLGLNAFNQRFLGASYKGRYAETFFVLPMKEYLSYCNIYFNSAQSDCYYNYSTKKA